MDWFTRVALMAVVVLVGIQFIPVDRSNPPVTSDVQAPAEVDAILRRACYDCHSNETVWPWYSRVAPVSWLIAEDVEEGREELNFSTWPPGDSDTDSDSDADSNADSNADSDGGVAGLLEDLDELIEEEEMPPWYYVLMHSDADLGHEERTQLRAWAARLRTTLTPAAASRGRH